MNLSERGVEDSIWGCPFFLGLLS